MNHGRPVKHLRITVAVTAYRIRFTAVGPLDAATGPLLTEAVRGGLGRHGAAVCEVGAELVTDLDRSGAAAIEACRVEAERRGLVFNVASAPARLAALLDTGHRRG